MCDQMPYVVNKQSGQGPYQVPLLEQIIAFLHISTSCLSHVLVTVQTSQLQFHFLDLILSQVSLGRRKDWI